MLINDLEYFDITANYSGKYNGVDSAKKCIDPKWFREYPVQNFDYNYNSWGFRGSEYQNYIGKKVNICLGDSFTVNVGGPIEHSWCSQLAKHFDIPTLNLGMDGAGNDAIRLVYERACKLFDVQNTFVMYSYLHRRLVNGKFVISAKYTDEENFEYFLFHRIPWKSNVYECTLPEFNLNKAEHEFISNLEIYFLDELYFSNFQTIDRKFIDGDAYNYLRGNEWPTLEQFVQGADPHPDMLTKEFGQFISNVMLTNRDGKHLNQQSNKLYADYFYNQWKQRNES